ncbi:MAG: hypothetical protein PVJ03_07955 [Chromatiaceae bacterium]|jgi:hypothetical protein
MLTIKDLSASKDLDRAAMTDVRGGRLGPVVPFFGIVNAPIIDTGVHELSQVQGAAIDQSGNMGGFNGVANWQYQNGVSGQAVG